MTDAHRAIDEARRRLATDGARAAYEQLQAAGATDSAGLIELESGRLALALRRPDVALAHLQRAQASNPDSAAILFEIGRALNNLRRPDEAARAFKRALRRRPDWLEARLNLAHVLRAAGRFEEAADAYDHALALDPASARAHAGAASMHVESGNLVAAEAHFARACQLDPEIPGVWLQRGRALQSAGALEAAVAALTEAVARAPDDAVAHSALGSAHQSCGDLSAARSCFLRALELDPGQPGATAALAGVLDLEGDGEGARALLAPLLARADADPVATLAFANLKSNLQVDDALLRRLSSTAQRPDVSPTVQALLHFRLGDALDQRDEFNAAFEQYCQANAIRALPFDQRALRRHTRRVVARIDAGGEVASGGGLRPIFIVGLPRSGTSLVEQILSRHSALAAAGERREFAVAATSALGDALREDVPEIGAPALAAVADGYRTAMAAVADGRAACTDKMWQNFEWLWLIRRALPEAAIVHCRRHPMAVGWSCFQRAFGAAPPPFASTLTDIAAFIGHHDRITEAWRTAGRPGTLDLCYEELVGDIDGQVRRLLDFLGLPFEADCVAFHRARRTVTTESFAQVNQPLYTRSVDRWRCYERELAPLRTALEAHGVRAAD